MAKVGIRWDRSIVANLDLGRRATVSVDELLALATVLDCSPWALLPDGHAQPAPVERVTASQVRVEIESGGRKVAVESVGTLRNVKAEALDVWAQIDERPDPTTPQPSTGFSPVLESRTTPTAHPSSLGSWTPALRSEQ